MSVKVSSWVWHGEETAELAGNEMILLLALADVADDNGRCRFLTEDDDLSYRGLARKARVSRSTVIRIMAKFRDANLIEQVKGVKGRSNEIRIIVPWARQSGSKLEPIAPDGPNDSVPSETDSVPTEQEFGSKSDEHASLIRKDVIDVARVRPGFAEFYLIYPRKVGKEAARKAFEKAAKSTEPEVIIEGARRFAADPNLPEKQFIPHPATWLNAGRWDDEPLPPRVGAEHPEVPDYGRDEWMYRA